MANSSKANERTQKRGKTQRSNSNRWREHDARHALDAWEKSGESLYSFALRVGISPKRLYWWRQRLAQSSPPKSPVPAFVPVIVRPPEALSNASPRTAIAQRPIVGASVASSPLSITVSDATRIDIRELDAATALWVATLLNHIDEARR